MKSTPISLAVLLVISGIALADDGDAPKDQPAKFKITTKRKTTPWRSRPTRTGRCSREKPVRDQPGGHRAAGDEWPKAVVLRLHLKGL